MTVPQLCGGPSDGIEVGVVEDLKRFLTISLRKRYNKVSPSCRRKDSRGGEPRANSWYAG